MAATDQDLTTRDPGGAVRGEQGHTFGIFTRRGAVGKRDRGQTVMPDAACQVRRESRRIRPHALVKHIDPTGDGLRVKIAVSGK